MYLNSKCKGKMANDEHFESLWEWYRAMTITLKLKGSNNYIHNEN